MPTTLALRCATIVLLAGAALAGVPDAAARRAEGCLSRSALRPWGNYPLRVWTPRKAATDYTWMESEGRQGVLNAPPFRARLVQAYSVDEGDARRVVELDTAAGCRRLLRADGFSAADNAFIDAEVARHPAPGDPAAYAVEFEPDRADAAFLAKGTLRKYETQHFAFWYGTNKKGQSYRHVGEMGQNWDRFIERAGAWAEMVWQLDRDVLHAPMPYADRPADARKKINVYVRGTGLPFMKDGDLEHVLAGGASAISISALQLSYGSWTLTHEMGHVIQWYSGGFRNFRSAGPIWETGAEWNTNTLNIGGSSVLAAYHHRLNMGPFASDARYGAFPFMALLYEQDRTRPLVWKAWTHNVRDSNGSATEDFVPTIIRLGEKAGIYPHGMRSFADDMGWYGARLVTSDFSIQRTMLDTLPVIRGMFGGSMWSSLTSGKVPGTFTPSRGQELHQFGTNLIPLKVTGANRKVSVTLTGGTKADAAAWRFVLVAVRGEADASYSMLGTAEGRGSATISTSAPRNAELYLAVTATPYLYQSSGWQKAGSTMGAQFPYWIRIRGATPR